VHIDQQVIDLATGIQRRRDFTAHTTGFAAGAVVVGSLTLAGVRGGRLHAATLLTWATALSFQHFRHVLRGPVTVDAVRAEAVRRCRGSGSGTPHDAAGRPGSAGGPRRLMTKGHPAILSQLSHRGVRFALGGSVYDWNDPFARMFLKILAVTAEFEASLIRSAPARVCRSPARTASCAAGSPGSSPPRTARSAACTTAATTTSPSSPPCSASAGPPCTGPWTARLSSPASRRHPARA